MTISLLGQFLAAGTPCPIGFPDKEFPIMLELASAYTPTIGDDELAERDANVAEDRGLNNIARWHDAGAVVSHRKTGGDASLPFFIFIFIVFLFINFSF